MPCSAVGTPMLRVQALTGPLTQAPRRAPATAPRRRRQAQPPAAFFNRGAGKADSSSNDRPSATGSNTRETLVSDGAIKGLSPEARRIFREAQDNIIELNKSRLRALEELKAARTKIAELEERLESAVQEASHATAALQQLGPSAAQQAAEAAAAPAAPAADEVTYSFDAAAAAVAAAVQQQQAEQQQQQQQQHYEQQQQQQQQVASQPPAQQVPAEAGPTITVVYETGWSAAFLHHNPDDRGWTTIPGQRMDNGSQQFPDKMVLSVPARRLEFVINDGASGWDKPNPWDNNGKANYVIDSPGTYRVKNGRVTRLA